MGQTEYQDKALKDDRVIATQHVHEAWVCQNLVQDECAGKPTMLLLISSRATDLMWPIYSDHVHVSQA